MRELAARHQVLCITHLPQVAAAATTQFVVTKEVAHGRTFSGLRSVKGKARQEEIARMLGGRSESALTQPLPCSKCRNRRLENLAIKKLWLARAPSRKP